MQCKHCGAELTENAKFCMNCGAKVEIEEVKTTEPVKEEPVVVAPVVKNDLEETVVVQPPKEETPSVEDAGVKEWYYVENNVSKGPCTENEIKDLIAAGTLSAFSFVWKEGMTNWTVISETQFGSQSSVQTTPQQTQTPPQQSKVVEEKEWYYITGQNNQEGPVEESLMKTLIENRVINGNTYVWKEGMTDWDFVKNTVLARYLNSTMNTNSTAQTNGPVGAGFSMIQKRSIPMCILLSIVTCGIYTLFWLYSLVEDTNKVLASQGRPQESSGGMVILLSIVTCNIYLLYWLYKAGKSLGEVQFTNGYKVNDDSLVMTLLAVFGLGLISYCILQSTLNDITDYASL